MNILIRERKKKTESYKVGELEIHQFPPIEKIVIYPTSYSALSLIKEAEVIRYDQGGMKGFLIKSGERIYWLRMKRIGAALEIIVSKINNSGERKWTDSEIIPIPSEEGKKELWVPIDEHFLFSGTPWLEELG